MWEFNKEKLTCSDVVRFNERVEAFPGRYPKHDQYEIYPGCEIFEPINGTTPHIHEKTHSMVFEKGPGESNAHEHFCPSGMEWMSYKRWLPLGQDFHISIRGQLVGPSLANWQNATNSTYFMIWQLHSMTDKEDSGGNPNISLMFNPKPSPHLTVWVNGDSRPAHTKPYEFTKRFEKPFIAGPIDFDCWFKSEWEPKGYCRGFLNGEAFDLGTNISTCYNNRPVGQYTWEHEPTTNYEKQTAGPCYLGAYSYSGAGNKPVTFRLNYASLRKL